MPEVIAMEKPELPRKRLIMAKRKRIPELQETLSKASESINRFPLESKTPEIQLIIRNQKILMEGMEKLLDIFGQ